MIVSRVSKIHPLNIFSIIVGSIIYSLNILRYKAIFGVLFLYTIYALQPAMNLKLFSKTLVLAPGEILSLILVLLFLDKIFLKSNNEEKTNNKLFWGLIIMGFLFLISTLLFYFSNNDLVANMPRSLLMFSKWLMAPVLFFIACNSKVRVKDLKIFVLLLIGFFIISVCANLGNNFEDLLAIITKSLETKYTRLSSAFPDPNQFGEITALFIIISLNDSLNSQVIWRKLLNVVLISFLLIMLALTQSREAMLTLIIAIFSLGILKWRTRHQTSAIVIFSIAIFALISLIPLVPRLFETLVQITSGETVRSLDNRDSIWIVALETIIRYPLGIGFENLSYITNGHYFEAHNAFLQAAVVSGLPGLTAYLFFVHSLYKLLKSYVNGTDNKVKWITEAYFVFFFGYMVTSLFSDHFITFYIFNAIFFGMLGLAVSIDNTSL